MSVEPFPIAVDEAALDDLRDRLARTRWPDAEVVDDWSQGAPLAYVRDLADTWATTYDWRRCEARLNAIGSWRTEIDGLGIWFLHRRSPHPGALPLVLTHGWPGSVLEFSRMVEALTDPTAHGGDAADAFHVVIPSLPGYGFSDKPTTVGWGVERIADAWAELMTRLGYSRFAAHGGDWGSGVTMMLAMEHPDRLAGIHLTMPVAIPDPSDATDEERAALATLEEHRRWDSGYSKLQSTRPQTVGYGLTDSPVAQLAWIVEKLHAWTDNDGDLETAISRDDVLDDVMLYWLPGAATSSARLYWESFSSFDLRPIDVPTGVSIFPKDLLRMSRRWLEPRFTDLRHHATMEHGGHFPGLEQPEALVDELRTTFRSMR